MMNRLAIMVLGLMLLAQVGCDGSPRTESPEELGRQVFETLKQNDVEAFLKLCASREDFDAVVAKADMDEKKRKENVAWADERFTDELVAKLRDKFRIAYEATDWADAAIKEVEIDEIEIQDGIERTDWIKVHLNNGKYIRVHDSVKAPRGWVIGDDNPVSVHEER